MGFKEAGEFSQAYVPDTVRNGGVYFDQKGHAEYSVNHQNFRLRVRGQEQTEVEVSTQDIKPIKIHPGKVVPNEIPLSQEITCGLEAEFMILDSDGNTADLYGGNRVFINGKDRPEIDYSGEHEWLIDTLGVSPEGLRFQAEVNTEPGRTWEELEYNTLLRLRNVYLACRKHNLYLLPTGLLGEKLEKDWNNISAHPYILKIHSHGLRGTALNFDSNTVQAHADLRPFGSSDFGLYAANIYNNGLATLHNAISVSSPFWGGRITNNLSNREFARNKLSTVGGVQGDVPVNGNMLLQVGDQLVRSGKIPVPERAFGSHSDTRPAKLTTGTFEAGSADMTGNVDYWFAQAFINRQFLIKIAEHLKNDLPVPPFMEKTDFETRKGNRWNSAHFGPNFNIKIANGAIGIREVWNSFFIWAEPNHVDSDWEKSKDAVLCMLSSTKSASYGERAIEAYFDTNNQDTYLKGNLAEAMLTYAQSLAPMKEGKKIRLTNKEVATHFMNDLHFRLVQTNLL